MLGENAILILIIWYKLIWSILFSTYGNLIVNSRKWLQVKNKKNKINFYKKYTNQINYDLRI